MDHTCNLGEVVVTGDGTWTLAHAAHGETYHSSHGALAEATGLYVGASGIAARFAAPGAATRVLDVGLGLGYNALATLEAWLAAPAPGPLTIVSLEIDAALAQALGSGTGAWQGNWPPARLALARALGREPLAHPSGAVHGRWELELGDALEAPLPGAFDFVWQDPFSPTKNPTMWSAAWFRRVRAAAAPGCVLVTYSVARAVREALAEAGWQVDKIPTGTGRKRHWLRALNTI
jgi:tRNA U34 5-methylaminomethyl-2-thiouridine-forming methyltransferase MnmC